MNRKIILSLATLAAFAGANAQFTSTIGDDVSLDTASLPTAVIETELRSGNYANNGDWEVGTGPRDPNTGFTSPVSQAQYDWSPNGQSFKFMYDANAGLADLLIDGSSVVSDTTTPGFLASDLYIRIRAAGDTKAFVTNLT
ncbi:MAG: choice-of-anchor W domain-containing protein, partial [Fimbriimonadaceae bacterium]